MLLADLEGHIHAAASGVPDASDLDRLTGGLLIAHLMNGFVMDPRLEHSWPGAGAPAAATPRPDGDLTFLIALAHQGFINEFIWDVTQEERQRLDRLEARSSNR